VSWLNVPAKGAISTSSIRTQAFFVFWETIASGAAAIAHVGPRDVAGTVTGLSIGASAR
jgi:hypothetical protein